MPMCQMLALLDDDGLVSSLEGRVQAILAHRQQEPSLSSLGRARPNSEVPSHQTVSHKGHLSGLQGLQLMIYL